MTCAPNKIKEQEVEINTILIADTDNELIKHVTDYLKAESLATIAVNDGDSAIKKALNQPFAAIILELILPKKNGFEVIQAIRQHADVPIVVLSAKAEDIDRIIALELGADDFLSKPCNPHELIATLHSIFRRSKIKSIARPVIQLHQIMVDTTKREATIKGIPLDLTNAEFNILEMLIKSPGQAFSKQELTELALGRPFTAYDRSIDVHISNLRNKLGDTDSGEPLLKTIRGFGYMLRDTL